MRFFARKLPRQSELKGYSDEGFSEHFGEVAVDHNVDIIVGPLVENDVIRFGFTFTGEEADAQLDIAAAGFAITH